LPREKEVAVIAFDCAKCGKTLRVGEEFAGKTGQCPSCGEEMLVPDHSPAEPSSSAAPQSDTVLDNPVQPPLSRREALRSLLGEEGRRRERRRRRRQGILSEDGVTPARLQRFFKAAFLKAEIDEDEDVKVRTDAGITVWISIEAERKLLKYVATYGFKEDVTEVDRLQLVNTLNDNVILVRFSVPREDVLMADYYLYYEEGIVPYQIVNSLRHFANITVKAIREYDTDDLIE
jgi:hypothetical protein